MLLLAHLLLPLLSLSAGLASAASAISGQPYSVTSLCLHIPPAVEHGVRCNKTVSFALFDPEPKAPTHAVCEASWPANATDWPTSWMRVSGRTGDMAWSRES